MKKVKLKKAARRLVKAWESLEGGRRHSPSKVERWLRDDMGPAVDEVRKSLKKPA